jgi:protein-S-isoprenylcysteine O-methyltransferase Ste14
MERGPFSVLFVLFMVFVTVQRVLETFKRRPTLKGELSVRWSFPLLMGVHTLIFAGTVVEYFLVARAVRYWLSAVAVLLYAGSVLLRNLAIRTLGRYWSLHIEIRSQHRLVRQGVYGLVRHPAYLSVVVELVSVPLVANAYFTLLVTVLVYVPLLMWRLRHEEQALVAKFGEEYRSYQQEVGRLLPKWSALRRLCLGNRRGS